MPRRTNHPVTNPVFDEPVFGEGGQVIPDPTRFAVPHPDDKATYASIQDALKHDVVPFDKSRIPDDQVYPLAQAFGSHGPDVINAINTAKKIVFHALGDSGASMDGKKYRDELSVTDVVAAESRDTQSADCPAFLYHLGDVVYDFGEAEYYYDQFYDPFRNYTRPIFAIPGNHDSFIVPGAARGDEPLRIFGRNFCSPQSAITPEAHSLHRTSMTQPGVYFALDAPFVRIIGLFSNSLEDPGVISSENGHWLDVPDYQLDYLRAQLTKIWDEKYSNAVLIAVHHPPFAFATQKTNNNAGNHAGSPAMLGQIDTICKQVGVYPHAVLSGHAHNYQRYTRTIAFKSGAPDYQVPFVVCGNGGHNATPLVYHDFKHLQDPKLGSDVSYLEAKKLAVTAKGLTIDYFDDYNFGYLRVTADANTLNIAYFPVGGLGGIKPDSVKVDLKSHRLA